MSRGARGRRASLLLCVLATGVPPPLPSSGTASDLPTAEAAASSADTSAGASGQATVPFRPGMVVTESVRVEPGTYEVDGPESLDEALIVVRGDGITLDLEGVRLQGLPVEADPDLATGVAVRVDGGRDVTIRNAHLRGYRFGVLARGTENLRLVDNELGYGWKPRLFSRIDHESLVDWLSFHHNEEREWMRFGAAIYLEDVRGGEVAGNRAVQGMNGLLMTRAEGLTVRDNEFAFNSGLGIGLYRSERNTIVRNRLDYNVRGYSEGFYQRGQDSAAILLYEQSSNNVVAYNSATHSGDGLFLWAGQHTMDTGEGGANDNLVFGNDFSFAPANGIEVTFSRNRIVANRVEGSRYGVWGGYSWETLIAGNCFAGNETGIAIEHGQDNHIDRNRFDGHSTAVALWANPTEPPDWGYPRHRDTRSRDTLVTGNVFVANDRIWRLDDTAGLAVIDNVVREAIPAAPTESCDPGALLGEDLESLAPGLAFAAASVTSVTPALDSRTPGLDSAAPDLESAAADLGVSTPTLAAPTLSSQRPALPEVWREIPESPLARRDRSAIVVDEWGPYDWRSPKLWPVDAQRSPVRLRVLGPPGRWRLRDRRGVTELSAESGRTGETLVVTPAAGAAGDWAVHLEYVGERTVSPRGIERPAGEVVPFSFARFDPEMQWQARFFTWTEPARDPPADPDGFATVFERQPVLERTEGRLDHVGYRPLVAELPQERWALEGSTTVSLPPGEYSIRTISDDGIRVWVDDALVIDNWERPHGSVVDHAPLPGGEHRLRVRYYQLAGWSELRVEIVRGSPRSAGSPGPH